MRPTPRTDAFDDRNQRERTCSYRAAREFSRTLEHELAEAVELLNKSVIDREATYDACKRNGPIISIGQFKRLNEARAFLDKVK